MAETEATFGARYTALASINERMALEAAEARRGAFAEVDAVLDRLIGGALRGERVAALIPPKTKRDADRVELRIHLTDEERAAVAEHFEVANQEKRGSWHVPKDEVVSLGLMHTVHWTRHNPRLALSMADAERARPVFRDAPEAVAAWVLEPLFEELFLPLKLRGLYWLGKKTVDDQVKSWKVIDPLYAALGLDPSPLDAFRPGTGWSRHTSADIVALRQALVGSWASAPDDVGARYRAYRIGQLVDRYYAKAKKGVALRKSVLTKPLGRTLTAYFGGDWLAFLAYLGEEPHPSEEIVQALPETKLLAATSDRAAAVAAEHGLSAEEVQRMLAAYWQQSDHASPVEKRVDVIKRFWTAFDDAHAKQRPGMPSLWGLVEEDRFDSADDPDSPYQPGGYRRVLAEDLNADIARLWGTMMLPRWSDRLVSEPSPHARMAAAIGPALQFWHGAALTAWFLCEGPYSRTDIDGLPNYLQPELTALKELDCPVDGALFRGLREAQERYGKPKHDTSEGLVITIRITGFGDDEEPEEPSVPFEVLRDIITRHRRAWTERFFEPYVRARWEGDLRTAGDGYHRLTAERSKPPTPKMFAKLAAAPANLWFGGDITGVYGALGLKAPDAPTSDLVMPADPTWFVRRVFENLGGQPRDDRPLDAPKEREAQWKHNNRSAALAALARQSIYYVQLQEVLARPPELNEFTKSKFYGYEELAADMDDAWRIYSDAVQAALTASHTPAARLPEVASAPTDSADGGAAQPWKAPAPATPDTDSNGGTSGAADWSAALNDAAQPQGSPAEAEPEPRSWAGRSFRRLRNKP